MTFTHGGYAYRLYFHHMRFDDRCLKCNNPPNIADHYDAGRPNFHTFEAPATMIPTWVVEQFNEKGLRKPKGMTVATLAHWNDQEGIGGGWDAVAEATTFCASVDQYSKVVGRERALDKLLSQPTFTGRDNWTLGRAVYNAYTNREHRGADWRAKVLEEAAELVLEGIEPLGALRKVFNEVRKSRGLKAL